MVGDEVWYIFGWRQGNKDFNSLFPYYVLYLNYTDIFIRLCP